MNRSLASLIVNTHFCPNPPSSESILLPIQIQTKGSAHSQAIHSRVQYMMATAPSDLKDCVAAELKCRSPFPSVSPVSQLPKSLLVSLAHHHQSSLSSYPRVPISFSPSSSFVSFPTVRPSGPLTSDCISVHHPLPIRVVKLVRQPLVFQQPVSLRM